VCESLIPPELLSSSTSAVTRSGSQTTVNGRAADLQPEQTTANSCLLRAPCLPSLASRIWYPVSRNLGSRISDPSSFILHPSAFILQPSAFSIDPASPLLAHQIECSLFDLERSMFRAVRGLSCPPDHHPLSSRKKFQKKLMPAPEKTKSLESWI
jgi:hypothetical protein